MSTYDDFFFSSKPNPERSPNSFAVVANLFGAKTVDLHKSSILDIGCSTGANIQAIAWSFPNSQFVAFDSSEAQVEFAKKQSIAIGLENLSLHCSSIRDFIDANTKRFDYIICSGLFSWVTDDTREEILECIEKFLSPHGIAFLNFNSLPGWSTRSRIRDAIRAKIDPSMSLEAKLAIARDTLEREAPEITNISDALIVHELLAEDVKAFYHDEVRTLCDKHHLSYFADARFSRARFGPLDAEIRGALISREENKTFDTANEELLADVFLSSTLVPNEESSGDEFFSPHGRIVRVANKTSQAHLHALAKSWPQATINPGFDGGELLELFEKGYIKVYASPPRCVSHVSAMPTAAAFSRQQARQENWATNTRHEFANLRSIDAEILSHLDGTISPEELATKLDHNLDSILESLHLLAEHGFLIA